MEFMDVVETSSSIIRQNSAGLHRTAASNNFQSSSLVFPNATELRQTSSDDMVSFTPEPRQPGLPDVDDRIEATETLSRLGTSTGQSQRPSLARPMDLDPGANSASASSCTMPCCQLQAPVGGPTDNMTASVGGTLSQASKSGSRLVYTSERHPRCLLEAMNSLREKQELYDVVLLVDGHTIYTHRAVLAACSPYFRAMFTSELAESKQLEIPLYDLDGEAVETMISFCYTSQIAVEESNVQNLLPAACLLQLTEIQEVCCEFLKRQLDPTNCLGIRAFADTHACADLLQAADRFVHANFLEVVESEEFLLLPFNQLGEILSSDELNTHNEEAVYLALMRWVHYQLPKRRRHLPHLLQFIRLPFMSPKFLVSTVGSDVLIRSDERCRDLVDEAKNYLLLPQERVSMQGPRTRPREALAGACGGVSGFGAGGGKELLFAVGGWCSGDAIASAEFYNPRSHEWHMVAPMQKRRCGVGVGVVNDLLYAVGGHDGQSYLNSVERYDPHTNQWSSDIAPTSTCRTSVGVAVLNGIMYAVGGQDGVSCLNMVERHDPVVNKWSKVASMSTSRLGVGVAVLNGQLYAVGGSDGRQPLSSVEQFDPRVGVWHRVTCMGTRRKHLGVAVYNNLIYAVGGRDEIMEASSAECFDPRNCSWSPVVALMSRRSGVGLAVVNNQLVAVGGFDGGTYLKTVEVYDREANCWRIRGCMNSRRLGGGVGVIRYANCSGASVLGWAPDQSAPLLHQRHTAYRLPWSETDVVGRETGSGAGSGCLVAGAHSQPIPPGLSTSMMPVRSTAATTSETPYHLPGLSQSMLIPGAGGGGAAADLIRVASPGGGGSGLLFSHLRYAHTTTASAATVSPPVTTASPAPVQSPPSSSPTESTLTTTSRTETITPSLADTIGTSLSSDESLPSAVLF